MLAVNIDPGCIGTQLQLEWQKASRSISATTSSKKVSQVDDLPCQGTNIHILWSRCEYLPCSHQIFALFAYSLPFKHANNLVDPKDTDYKKGQLPRRVAEGTAVFDPEHGFELDTTWDEHDLTRFFGTKLPLVFGFLEYLEELKLIAKSAGHATPKRSSRPTINIEHNLPFVLVDKDRSTLTPIGMVPTGAVAKEYKGRGGASWKESAIFIGEI